MAPTVQFSLRLHEKLHQRIKREAKRKGRPLNKEIIERLEESFSREDILDDFRQVLDERNL